MTEEQALTPADPDRITLSDWADSRPVRKYPPIGADRATLMALPALMQIMGG